MMIQKMIDQIIENQVQKKMIDSEEINIYKYGYMLVYEVVLNIILALAIGIIFKCLGGVLFFLCMYIPLRSFCGGWHADKIWKCTLASNFILLAEVLCVKYIAQYINIGVLLFAFITNMIIIICMAPVETEAKKISKTEHVIYKKKIYIIVFVHVIAIAIITVLQLQNYIFVIAYVYGIQVGMLFVEKFKSKL